MYCVSTDFIIIYCRWKISAELCWQLRIWFFNRILGFVFMFLTFYVKLYFIEDSISKTPLFLLWLWFNKIFFIPFCWWLWCNSSYLSTSPIYFEFNQISPTLFAAILHCMWTFAMDSIELALANPKGTVFSYDFRGIKDATEPKFLQFMHFFIKN